MQFETYPFEKLQNLLADITPNGEYAPLTLTIGEPQFETPEFIQAALKNSTDELKKYPKTGGLPELKAAQQNFVQKRFGIALDEAQIIPTFGTREVLFNFPQYLLFDKKDPVMAFTNPFYQIYEGAAIASRAKSVYIGIGDYLSPEQMKAVDLVIINYPNNPTAVTLGMAELEKWARYATEYDFVLLNDECYSEIYTDTPPPSLLQAARNVGNGGYENILVINSVSKRSSAPGLRSGFIAGDAKLLEGYMRYRTYVGAASPQPLQRAAIAAWNDEAHVQVFREAYRQNFAIAKEVLDVDTPEATFYVWLQVGDELAFAKKLYKEYNLKVIPGSFLGREGAGQGYIRIALVLSPEDTKEALRRIAKALEN